MKTIAHAEGGAGVWPRDAVMGTSQTQTMNSNGFQSIPMNYDDFHTIFKKITLTTEPHRWTRIGGKSSKSDRTQVNPSKSDQIILNHGWIQITDGKCFTITQRAVLTYGQQ